MQGGAAVGIRVARRGLEPSLKLKIGTPRCLPKWVLETKRISSRCQKSQTLEDPNQESLGNVVLGDDA